MNFTRNDVRPLADALQRLVEPLLGGSVQSSEHWEQILFKHVPALQPRLLEALHAPYTYESTHERFVEAVTSLNNVIEHRVMPHVLDRTADQRLGATLGHPLSNVVNALCDMLQDPGFGIPPPAIGFGR